MAYLENSHSSSIIAYSTYDTDTKILLVEFNSGAIYEYHEVPLDEYENLNSASSAGVYFTSHIKNNYNYIRK